MDITIYGWSTRRGMVRSLEDRPVLTHEWIEYGGSAIKG